MEVKNLISLHRTKKMSMTKLAWDYDLFRKQKFLKNFFIKPKPKVIVKLHVVNVGK